MNMFKKLTVKTPEEYIGLLAEPRRGEIKRLHEFIQKAAPKLKPYIAYGMIGYGEMPYKSRSGREGTWPALGLASQKNYISIYSCVVKGGEYLAEKYKDKLGKVSVGKSCMRYKKAADISWNELGEVLKESQAIALERGIFN